MGQLKGGQRAWLLAPGRGWALGVLVSWSVAAAGGGLETVSDSSTNTHWAFVKPKASPPPSVRDRAWVQTTIDRFILAALEARDMKPAPAADKRTLIRRATFDLIGLPPTPEEVRAFLDDTDSKAFARVVDRLLSSPHYGERWGRYWLDVARYADTKGYVYTGREEKNFVHSFVYRDWVVRALNEDLPYDRFLLLQIAADQAGAGTAADRNDWMPKPSQAHSPKTQKNSPEADSEDLAALGFLTLGRRFLGVVHDIIDDRIDVVMRGTQALTVGCARCHDHKYDPIPTADYYSLYGVFKGSFERTVPVGPAIADMDGAPAYHTELNKRVQNLENKFQELRTNLIERLRDQTPRYLVAVLTADRLPTEEFYEIRGPDDLNPTIVRQWQTYLYESGKRFDPVFAPWHAFAALPAESLTNKAAQALETTRLEAERRGQALNTRVLAAFQAHPPRAMTDVAEVYGRLFAEANGDWKQLKKEAGQDGSGTNRTALLDPAQEALRLVLYGPDSPANLPPGALTDLEWFFDEPGRVQLGQAQVGIEQYILQSRQAEPYSVILEDRPMQKSPRVFQRGNPANPGVEVPRQFLQCLSGPGRVPFSTGSGRLDLARAIASRDNPLTARVMVNRVWLHYFGAGLVKTPSDFGARAEPPSHPELLDWLAVWFMNEQWSLKKLHRLILLSSVYQQQSHATQTDVAPTKAQSARMPVSDPENRFLSHMNPRRLDFESMRDALLAASGELDLAVGGKAEDLFTTPFSKRRSIYGHIDRQFLPGVLRVFDFANPDMHSPARAETTVPQQALFFLNSPFVLGRARTLAARKDVQAAASPSQRIQRLYQTVFQRPPSSAELEAGLTFIEGSASVLDSSTPPPAKSNAWLYGFGKVNEGAGRVEAFSALPHFTGEAWQGGEKWPDPALGWVQLTAEGGHAGNDLDHAAIRRWVAPRSAVISIESNLRHQHAQGDGIRAWILSSKAGILGQWTVHNQTVEPRVERLKVETGDRIDFVVNLRDNLNADDFKWAPTIREIGEETRSEKAVKSEIVDKELQGNSLWEAKAEFSGPVPAVARPLDAWEEYAQVLLLSNEFLFVD